MFLGSRQVVLQWSLGLGVILILRILGAGLGVQDRSFQESAAPIYTRNSWGSYHEETHKKDTQSIKTAICMFLEGSTLNLPYINPETPLKEPYTPFEGPQFVETDM